MYKINVCSLSLHVVLNEEGWFVICLQVLLVRNEKNRQLSLAE